MESKHTSKHLQNKNSQKENPQTKDAEKQNEMEPPKGKRKRSDKDASCSTSIEETEPYFNFDSSDLKDLVEMKAFVDKTSLIKAIFQDTPMIVITAPRRFGKSSNLEMVKRFFEIEVDKNGTPIGKEKSSNYQIFKDNNLLIFQDTDFFKENFATFPIIYVSFKDIDGNTFDEVLDKFRDVLRKVYKEHEYLLRSKKLTSNDITRFKLYYSFKSSLKFSRRLIESGLEFLSECLSKHFTTKEQEREQEEQKVFVLIDEYDAPINNAMFKENIDINDINDLVCMIFSHTLKGNEYVERALLAGILYFGAIGFSGANNVEKYMFLTEDKYVPYYGLTEGEVDKLLDDFKIDSETKDEVKWRYDGYLGSSGEKLFSGWSVLHFLKSKEIKNYCQESGVMSYLEQALNIPDIRKHIEKLYSEKSVDIKIEKIQIEDITELQKICLGKVKTGYVDPHIFLNFLLHQGYLTLDKKANNICTVKVPNVEILQEFQTKLLTFYCENSDFIKICAESFEKIFSTEKVEMEIFKDFLTNLNKVLDDLTKKKIIFEPTDIIYQCILVSILSQTEFSCSTEFRIKKKELI